MRACFASLLAAAAMATALGCSGDADFTDVVDEASTLQNNGSFTVRPGVERLRAAEARTDDVVAIQRASLELDNVFLLAQLARLAYEKPAALRARLRAMGLASDDAHFRFFEDRRTHTQAFYVTTAPLNEAPESLPTPERRAARTIAILAFRGTELTPTDISIDLRTSKQEATSLGGVHSGFARALRSVWNDAGGREGLGSFLRKHHVLDARGATPVRRGAELYFTGHSLGGALATLALAEAQNDGCRASSEADCASRSIPVSSVVTFGAPRVGDPAFAVSLGRTAFRRTLVFRVVNGGDLVPALPLSGFLHVGPTRDEHAFVVRLLASPRRVVVGEESDEEPTVADHSIDAYVSLLRELRR